MLAPHSFIASCPAARCALLLLGLAILPASAAYGQVDTVDTARPDTLQRPAPDTTRRTPTDTTRRPHADTTKRSSQPLRPQSFARPLYGRPPTDSIPGRLPHVSLEMILADGVGGFLYDLGEYGWPNGWSPRGLAPHRVHLWFDGLPFDDPLTGRSRYELLPPSFLERPRTGVDPGGGALGVHTRWRAYDPKRPLTEIRYRFDNSGLHAVEVGHSQKRRLDLFGRSGVLQLTLGYGGRKADGVYDGSRLRRERRIWGRLRYQTNDWTAELSNRSTIYRVGAHGGAVPLPNTNSFSSIYLLPVAGESVRNPRNRRKTVRNDLTARVRASLLPGLDRRTELSARWTSHTFDYRDGTQDTTLTTKLNGGHLRLRQSLTVAGHHLTGTARGSLWEIGRSDVPSFNGLRGAAHVALRDSLRLGATELLLDAGGHLTTEQMYPSARARMRHPAGPIRLSASVGLTGQRGARIEDEGFGVEGIRTYVRPLSTDRGGIADRLVEGRVGAQTRFDPFDLRINGFAHQIRNAVDLYADPSASTTYTDTVTARATSSPVRRAGVTLAGGWRRNARRGLYATGRGTLLKTLNADASLLHDRLARTLPTAFGQARIGARFVLFNSLTADLYVRARGWSAMNSRWFHPPTGRLVVPPRQNPVPGPGAPNQVGPSGTIDVRAEAQLRSATLFFTFQNVQAGTQLQLGTFVVPVYPLPPQQFRFGVFWPIFD